MPQPDHSAVITSVSSSHPCLNIGFTFDGLKKLTPDDDQFADAAFLKFDLLSLGALTHPSAPGHPSRSPIQRWMGCILSLARSRSPGQLGRLTVPILVFRRLRQDVKGFHAFVKGTAAQLAQTNPVFAVTARGLKSPDAVA